MSIWSKLFGSRKETTPPPPRFTASPPPSTEMPDFPFPLVSISSADAPAEWKKHNSEWKKEGASAVLITAETLRTLSPLLASDNSSVESLLRGAGSVSCKDFFEGRRAELAEDEYEMDIGEWPDGAVPKSSLQGHYVIGTRKPYATVYLAKIPTAKSWEIPAYLKFGGWNACPGPEEQVALLKYWAERYDIEVYSISSDVLECAVGKPPKTKDAALELATEQFLFCEDIVSQGTDTISGLAATIQDADAWFFWWD